MFWCTERWGDVVCVERVLCVVNDGYVLEGLVPETIARVKLVPDWWRGGSRP